MTKQQITYVAALLGGVTFYVFYQEWISTIVLWTLLLLPLVSVLCSLLAMRRAVITLECPLSVPLGTASSVTLTCSEALPFRGRLSVCRSVTGEQFRFGKRAVLPTDHCGALTVIPRRVRLYDRLGLIGIPVKVRGNHRTLIQPLSVEMSIPEEMDRLLSSSLRPKAGGGYSEVHELREYRPGDALNHIHWKLTAKAGKPIVREPMQPDVRWLLMTDIGGTADEMDRKLGRLQYISEYLLFLGIPFEVAAMTANGLYRGHVAMEGDLALCMEQLLCAEPNTGMSVREHTFAGWRQQYIGGEAV